LDKFEFLERNNDAIEELLGEISAILTTEHGADARPVTLEDVWVITNCEAGLTKKGKVNPSFVHSEGEVGLYPLPKNIKDWNGPDAPPFNKQTSLETNVHHYYLYLGHLKNKAVKTVSGIKLYRDLFRRENGDQALEIDAKMLAGVVHGYFFGGAYSDGKVPLQHLLDGYARDDDLADMMRATKYKHGQTSIVANRAKNIDAALERLKSFRE
jgi:hypothetical protein